MPYERATAVFGRIATRVSVFVLVTMLMCGCSTIGGSPSDTSEADRRAAEQAAPTDEDSIRLLEPSASDPPGSHASLVSVPDVTGLFITDAEAMLESKGLIPVEDEHYGPPPNALGMGAIFAQLPEPGSRVPTGSEVIISTWWESQ